MPTGLHADTASMAQIQSADVAPAGGGQDANVICEGTWEPDGRITYTLQCGLMLYAYAGCIVHPAIGGKWANMWHAALPAERHAPENGAQHKACRPTFISSFFASLLRIF